MRIVEMSSILTDVKHKIGPSEDYDYFDPDIIDNINEAFAVLNQLGLGPDEGFQIDGTAQEWEEFTTDTIMLNMIKQYVYKKVRVGFDAPNNSSHLTNLNDQISELEWRLNVEADPKQEVSS